MEYVARRKVKRDVLTAVHEEETAVANILAARLALRKDTSLRLKEYDYELRARRARLKLLKAKEAAAFAEFGDEQDEGDPSLAPD